MHVTPASITHVKVWAGEQVSTGHPSRAAGAQPTKQNFKWQIDMKNVQAIFFCTFYSRCDVLPSDTGAWRLASFQGLGKELWLLHLFFQTVSC